MVNPNELLRGSSKREVASLFLPKPTFLGLDPEMRVMVNDFVRCLNPVNECIHLFIPGFVMLCSCMASVLRSPGSWEPAM